MGCEGQQALLFLKKKQQKNFLIPFGRWLWATPSLERDTNRP
jgi:hypothetical protein